MDLITSLVSLYLSDRRKAIAKYATSAREMQEKVLRSLVRRAAKTEWAATMSLRCTLGGIRSHA